METMAVLSELSEFVIIPAYVADLVEEQNSGRTSENKLFSDYCRINIGRGVRTSRRYNFTEILEDPFN